MEGTGELVEKWEVDDMMNDGDKNQDGMLDYEGNSLCLQYYKKTDLTLFLVLINRQHKDLLLFH